MLFLYHMQGLISVISFSYLIPQLSGACLKSDNCVYLCSFEMGMPVTIIYFIVIIVIIKHLYYSALIIART